MYFICSDAIQAHAVSLLTFLENCLPYWMWCNQQLWGKMHKTCWLASCFLKIAGCCWVKWIAKLALHQKPPCVYYGSCSSLWFVWKALTCLKTLANQTQTRNGECSLSSAANTLKKMQILTLDCFGKQSSWYTWLTQRLQGANQPITPPPPCLSVMLCLCFAKCGAVKHLHIGPVCPRTLF